MRIWLDKTVDEEFEDLGTQGHTGTLNDRQFTFLATLSHTGSLADRMGSFIAGGRVVDSTAPVVTSSSYDGGTTTVSLDIVEATGSATCYWAFVANPSTPTEAQVVAGTGGGILESGSFTVTTGGDTDLIDLTAVTGNEIHIVIKDAAGNSTGTPSAGNNTVITGVTVGYVVTNDTEWDTVFGYSAATLSGKIVEVSGTNFTQRTINNLDLSALSALTIRSADASSSIPSLVLSGTTKKITCDGLNIQMTGWPKNHTACFQFSTGTFDEITFKNGTMRHGYGASLVDFVPSTQYDEYTRVDNVQTATTTTATYALTWQDATATSGWIEFFNRGANDVYAAVGGSGITASAADTLCPAGQRTRITLNQASGAIDPTTDTHVAIISTTSTSEINARAEIGMDYYLADGFFASGAATLGSMYIIGNEFEDLATGAKLSGGPVPYVIMDNTFRRIYMDIIASGAGNAGPWYVLRNKYHRPFARSGIAEELNGDAHDPHGDDIQNFGGGTGTKSYIYMAGNMPVYAARRTPSGGQGEFISDNNFDPSYSHVFSIGNIHTSGSTNGFNSGETSYPIKDTMIYGSTYLNYSDPTSAVLVTTETKSGESTYVGYSFASSFGSGGAGTQDLDGTVALGTPADYTAYMPNITDWETAGETTASIKSAFSAASGSNPGVGIDAAYSAIDWTTTDHTAVIKWDSLPAGVAWNDLTEQAASSVITLPLRRILNRGTGLTVVPGTGVEWRSVDTDGITEVTAWTTSSGTIDADQYIQIRKTSGAATVTVTASISINGFSTDVDITAADTLTNPFTMDGAVYFQDPSTLGSGVTKLEWETKMNIPSSFTTGEVYIASVVSNVIGKIINDGDFNLSVEDGNGVAAAVSTGGLGAGTFTEDAVQTLYVKVDWDTLTYDIQINGSSVGSGAITDRTPYNYFQTNRQVGFGTGTKSLPSGTQVEYHKVWKNGSLYKEISVAALGSIANINADSWKAGAGSVS